MDTTATEGLRAGEPATIGIDDLTALVHARRTHMLVDKNRPVDPALIERLCELATWAPNHKRTWPWRFALCVGDGRARLGEAYVADMIDTGQGDEGKRTKTLTKYLRAPAVMVVGAAAHASAHLHAENRDAVAAGIQTFLLGATTCGLASFWSSPPVTVSPRVNELCGFDPDTRGIGVVYLGWPISSVPAPARPAVDLHIVR